MVNSTSKLYKYLEIGRNCII